MKHLPILLLSACSLLTSCRSSIHDVSDVSIRSVKREVSRVHVVASKVDDAGVQSAWTLTNRGHAKESRIFLTKTFTETKAYIGLSVGAVTRERAQSIGVEPFKGVFVTEVKPESAAAVAGVSVGDIINDVDGYALSSREQYEDYCLQHATVDQGMQYSIRLLSKLGAYGDETQFAAVEIVPTGVDEARKQNASFEIEDSEAIYKYTGMRVGELTAERCVEMFDENKSRLIVTNVRVGSPAYYSGFRMGDQVLACDGVELESLNHLRSAVLAFFKEQGIEGALFDLAAAGRDESNGGFGSELLLSVNGRLGQHESRLEIDTELDEDSNFYFPILLDTTSDLNSSRVSFLDFIFQFGFNYKSQVLPSATREPAEAWSVSILPFGMFEISKGVRGSGRNSKVGNRYTLFWFIDFGSV